MSYLIVGLGNPGSRYRLTRHNIGFLAVDEIARRYETKFKRKFRSLIGDGSCRGRKFLLAKPCVYMNLSGEAVYEIVQWHKIDFEQMLLICDDVNLGFGKVRIRRKGSSGGHNGMESVIERVGSNFFPRLRIGIGSSAAGESLSEYVLGKFDRMQREKLEETIDTAADAAELWMKEGVEAVMGKYN